MSATTHPDCYATLPVHSPWGSIETRIKIADGLWEVGTASHGGIYASEERRASIDARFPERIGSAFYHEGRWYEEDCEWAYVAATFPELFPEATVERAHDLIRWQRQRRCAGLARGL